MEVFLREGRNLNTPMIDRMIERGDYSLIVKKTLRDWTEEHCSVAPTVVWCEHRKGYVLRFNSQEDYMVYRLSQDD